MMENLAVSALPKLGPAAAKPGEDGTPGEEDKGFKDTLSGLMKSGTREQNAPASGKPGTRNDAETKDAAEASDSAASTALATGASNAADTATVDNPSAQTMLGLFSSQTLAAPDTQAPANASFSTAGTPAKAIAAAANGLDSRLADAASAATGQAAATHVAIAAAQGGSKDTAASGPFPMTGLEATPATPSDGKLTLPRTSQHIDASQASAASVDRRQGNLRLTETGDRRAQPETGVTATQATGTSLPGAINQLNAAFQVNAAPSSPAAPVSAGMIATQVGAPGWSDAMGQRVLIMASGGIEHAEVRLNPEGLGPVHVVVSLDKGAAEVQFLAHDAMVRDALQSALPKLQDMLNSAGFSLDKVSIDSGSARNQGNHGGAESFARQQGESRRDAQDNAPGSVTRVIEASLPGRIDTFA